MPFLEEKHNRNAKKYLRLLNRKNFYHLWIKIYGKLRIKILIKISIKTILVLYVYLNANKKQFNIIFVKKYFI